jgi:hypothetical protein
MRRRSARRDAAKRSADRTLAEPLCDTYAASCACICAHQLQALLDALLLARCDFVIKTASALGEFALWLNARLRALRTLIKGMRALTPCVAHLEHRPTHLAPSRSFQAHAPH